MKKILSFVVISAIFILGSLNAFEPVVGQSIEAPTWRPGDIWQYNLTIESSPGHQTATIYVTGWGQFYYDEGTLHEAFDVRYIQNIIDDSDEYGRIYTRTDEERKITRNDYRLGYSFETTNILFEENHDNLTIVRLTKYNPLLDIYAFPINPGETWNQTCELNISRTVYRGMIKSEDNIIEESIASELKSYYFTCTGMEEIILTLADNPDVLSHDISIENLSVNWTDYMLRTYRIVQDDEEMDTDGTYVVEYYNASVGNIVMREIFTNGSLNTTAFLVYYEYTSGGPIEPVSHPENEGNGEKKEKSDNNIEPISLVIIIAIVIIMVFIIFIYKRRKQNPK